MREPTKMGRPREFDVNEALAAIMDVFWTKGFAGASMRDHASRRGRAFNIPVDTAADQAHHPRRCYKHLKRRNPATVIGGFRMPMSRESVN